jgi:peptidoglycan/LPS O-acetylase OafA/YrhL
LVYAFQKKRKLFWGYIVAASLFTVVSTIVQVPYSYYRQVMWIPWSLFLVLPWYFVKKEQQEFRVLPYLLLTVASVITFAVLYFVWMRVGRSLTLIDNKYPPNLYYLSFDGIGTFLLFALSGWSLLQKEIIRTIYVWISKVSYSLFFIHFIVLDFILSLQKHFTLPIPISFQVVMVIGISLCVAWVLALL